MLSLCKVCRVTYKQKKDENTCSEFCEKIKKNKIIEGSKAKDFNTNFYNIGGFRNNNGPRLETKKIETNKQRRERLKESKRIRNATRFGPDPRSITPEEMLIQSQKWKNVNAKDYAKAMEQLALNAVIPKKHSIHIVPKYSNGDGFYLSRAWRSVRYRVIKSQGRVCAVCKATNKAIEVDHIIPRSKDPSLALMESNLQVLCVDCNQGKGNTDSIDWRIKKQTA